MEIEEPITSDHSFTGFGPIDERDADSYHVEAEMYVAERGIEFIDYRSPNPSKEFFPYVHMAGNEIVLHIAQKKSLSEYVAKEEVATEQTAQKMIGLMGLLEFMPETASVNRPIPVLLHAMYPNNEPLSAMLEAQVAELQEKYRIKK